jgi:ribose-phosphate pyrophosphokinase
MRGFKIFAGSTSKDLAGAICQQLDMPVSEAKVSKFSDGEINAQIAESVRGRDVFIVQSTSNPANDSLMELLIMTDALRRSSAKSITAVIPYFGYARQDRKAAPRVPITAKLVANLIQTAGITRVVTLDLHAGQIQGFFDIPVDNLYGSIIFTDYLKKKGLKNPIIASPDVGGVARARSFAGMLGLEMVIVDKRREKANESEVMNIIGDVSGRTCLIIDDMIDTANTLCKAASALKERGAERVLAYASHAIFSGSAIERINASDIDQVVVTDSIPLSEEAKQKMKLAKKDKYLLGDHPKAVSILVNKTETYTSIKEFLRWVLLFQMIKL